MCPRLHPFAKHRDAIRQAINSTYNVLVKVGGVETALVLGESATPFPLLRMRLPLTATFIPFRPQLTNVMHQDTGSADLWVISDACTGNCSSSVPLYSQSTFQPTGQQVQLFYGDSHTGTHAVGPIGKDTVGIAGLSVTDQYLAAIIDTNTTVLETGSAGILGLGFPPIRYVCYLSIMRVSLIWHSVIWHQLNTVQQSTAPPSKARRQSGSFQSASATIASFATYGPLFARLIAQHALAQPMFATTLQRDTLDIGGNVGQLSIGELPANITSDSLTWVPLRHYTPQEGGLTPPPESPDEVCVHYYIWFMTGLRISYRYTP